MKKFKTKEELFDHLVENKDDMIYAKKCEIKNADPFSGVDVETITGTPLSHEMASKSENLTMAEVQDEPVVKVRAVINTTNWMDSHQDVHIKGIWNRSVKNNKRIKHIQEHKLTFDKIIADKEDLKVSVKNMTWKELGYDVDGETEALIFDSNVRKDRNPAMFKEYASDNVDNHSVGMQYVKIKLAVNSDKDGHKVEKANWDEYFPVIANKEEAERNGYFWAVLEAKVLEGSAVVNGSNSMTPTLPRNKHVDPEPQPQPDPASLEEKAIKEFLNL